MKENKNRARSIVEEQLRAIKEEAMEAYKKRMELVEYAVRLLNSENIKWMKNERALDTIIFGENIASNCDAFAIKYENLDIRGTGCILIVAQAGNNEMIKRYCFTKLSVKKTLRQYINQARRLQ